MDNKKSIVIGSIIALVILTIVLIITFTTELYGFFVVLLALFIIILISLGLYIKEKPDEYSIFQKEKKRILKTYSSAIIEVENLPNIANAGFKNVLTMPVQTPKSAGSSWWAFYQPLSFTIAENSALGTKAELIELCSEAEKFDICILADIVVNHMANIDDNAKEPDGTPVVFPGVAEYEPLIYNNRNEDIDGIGVTFHHNPSAGGSGSETVICGEGVPITGGAGSCSEMIGGSSSSGGSTICSGAAGSEFRGVRLAVHLDLEDAGSLALGPESSPVLGAHPQGIFTWLFNRYVSLCVIFQGLAKAVGHKIAGAHLQHELLLHRPVTQIFETGGQNH